jgi:hypothetical protein
MGQMTVKDAKTRESTLYGSNVMVRYATKEEYEKRLNELLAKGERVSGMTATNPLLGGVAKT